MTSVFANKSKFAQLIPDGSRHMADMMMQGYIVVKDEVKGLRFGRRLDTNVAQTNLKFFRIDFVNVKCLL